MLNYDVSISFNNKYHCHNVYDKLLDQFIASEYDVAEVILEGREKSSILNGLYRSKRRLGNSDIDIHTRDGKIYLSKV